MQLVTPISGHTKLPETLGGDRADHADLSTVSDGLPPLCFSSSPVPILISSFPIRAFVPWFVSRRNGWNSTQTWNHHNQDQLYPGHRNCEVQLRMALSTPTSPKVRPLDFCSVLLFCCVIPWKHCFLLILNSSLHHHFLLASVRWTGIDERGIVPAAAAVSLSPATHDMGDDLDFHFPDDDFDPATPDSAQRMTGGAEDDVDLAPEISTDEDIGRPQYTGPVDMDLAETDGSSEEEEDFLDLASPREERRKFRRTHHERRERGEGRVVRMEFQEPRRRRSKWMSEDDSSDDDYSDDRGRRRRRRTTPSSSRKRRRRPGESDSDEDEEWILEEESDDDTVSWGGISFLTFFFCASFSFAHVFPSSLHVVLSTAGKTGPIETENGIEIHQEANSFCSRGIQTCILFLGDAHLHSSGES